VITSTFRVIDPGASRTADPAADPVVDLVTGTADGSTVIVDIPFTRTDAVVEVSFTDTYAASPVVVAPAFTG